MDGDVVVSRIQRPLRQGEGQLRALVGLLGLAGDLSAIGSPVDRRLEALPVDLDLRRIAGDVEEVAAGERELLLAVGDARQVRVHARQGRRRDDGVLIGTLRLTMCGRPVGDLDVVGSRREGALRHRKVRLGARLGARLVRLGRQWRAVADTVRLVGPGVATRREGKLGEILRRSRRVHCHQVLLRRRRRQVAVAVGGADRLGIEARQRRPRHHPQRLVFLARAALLGGRRRMRVVDGHCAQPVGQIVRLRRHLQHLTALDRPGVDHDVRAVRVAVGQLVRHRDLGAGVGLALVRLTVDRDLRLVAVDDQEVLAGHRHHVRQLRAQRLLVDVGHRR